MITSHIIWFLGNYPITISTSPRQNRRKILILTNRQIVELQLKPIGFDWKLYIGLLNSMVPKNWWKYCVTKRHAHTDKWPFVVGRTIPDLPACVLNSYHDFVFNLRYVEIPLPRCVKPIGRRIVVLSQVIPALHGLSFAVRIFYGTEEWWMGFVVWPSASSPYSLWLSFSSWRNDNLVKLRKVCEHGQDMMEKAAGVECSSKKKNTKNCCRWFGRFQNLFHLATGNENKVPWMRPVKGPQNQPYACGSDPPEPLEKLL